MYATIFYERGVNSEHIDAAQLAYQAIAQLSGQVAAFTIRPLNLQLPLLPSGQVDSGFIDHVRPEEGVSALFMTKRDMGSKNLNYCFGKSVFNGRAATVSTSRLEPETTFGLALHELGHSEGLVAACSPRYDRVSKFAGHCTNACVMEPVNNIGEMQATVTKFMESPATAGFCQPCADELSR